MPFMMGLLCIPLAPFLPLIKKMLLMLVYLYSITLLALLLPQAETDVTVCECWVLFPALFPSVQLCILFSSCAPVLITCGLRTCQGCSLNGQHLSHQLGVAISLS